MRCFLSQILLRRNQVYIRFEISNACEFGTVVSSNAIVSVTPLNITAQPQGICVLAGTNTTFSVTPSGQGPFSYQWELNGTNILGGTNSNLTVLNVSPAGAGFYAVAVSNAFGVLISSNALLMVIPIVISAQSQSETPFLGATTVLSVTAALEGPFYYEWQFDGTNILNNP